MSSAKSPQARLEHILENIDAIIAATRNRSPREITSDYLVQRGLERAVEIISEAAKALPPSLREREPEVPWSDIVGIGNLLRHEYYRIRADRMLDILNVHLPRLRPAVVRLLAVLDTQEPDS
jgi:uncharacterized protein with HEPN domain